MTVRIFLGALEIAMFARAILSWFPIDEDNPLLGFLDSVTEPFIAPVRALLERFDLFQDFPLDIAFFITFIIISILAAVL